MDIETPAPTRTDGPVARIPELPARMTSADMQQAFGLGRNRFYELERAGRFKVFEFKPQIGKRKWSGVKVAAYLRGEKVK